MKENNREAFYESKHKHKERISTEDGIETLFETYKFTVGDEDEKTVKF